MAFSLKPNKLCRSFYITFRNYCENKTIYERHEEGKKPRTVYGKPYPEWRKQWIDREGEWKSKLSVFVEKNPSANVLNILQNIPELNISKVKDWWTNMKELQEIQNQKFLPERVAILGSNLAALHFFAYRRCAVRLKESKAWIKGDITNLNLPTRFVDGYFIEAVDCTNFHHNGIRYEGLENLTGLHFLKWLSLKNNKYVDLWCLDRIAGQNSRSLEYLDISGCNLCVGGVIALARMSALKVLIVTDPGENLELQAALSALEQENPHLLIKAVENMKEEKAVLENVIDKDVTK